MSTRLDYMDNLRAIAMLLGLIVHGAIFFAPSILYPWPLHNHQTQPIFGYVISNIQVFRMPLFFLLAGFFAAMLYEKLKGLELIKHRAMRIALPFIIAMLLFSLYHSGELLTLIDVDPGKVNATVIYNIYGFTGALWFIYYLILAYMLLLTLHYGWQRLLPTSARQFIHKYFSLIISNPLNPLLFMIPSFILLMIIGNYYLLPPLYLMPHIFNLLYYLYFLGFGWILFLNQSYLTIYERYGWIYLSLGVFVTFPVYFYFFIHKNLITTHAGLFYLASFLYPLSAWLLTCGFVGTFKRFLNIKSRVLRYYADASYWFYFLQVPVLLVLQAYFYYSPIPPLLKLFYIMSIGVVFMTVTYTLFVRGTFIGKLLNGRRRPLNFGNRYINVGS